jgi:putative transposase
MLNSDAQKSMIAVIPTLGSRGLDVEFFWQRKFYVKKSKFSDSQIMDALKRVEAGLAVADLYLCREIGVSSAAFYKWRSRYGGMDTSMISRMKELEEENRRLKKMYVEEKLKAEIATEYLAKK